MKASLLAALFVLSQDVAALQVAPLRAAAAPAVNRAGQLSMSDAKGRKEWKYVKGINDYGKEQTYMYLGAKEGKRFLFSPVGEEGPLADIWEKAYLGAIFGPAALCGLYAISNLPAFN